MPDTDLNILGGEEPQKKTPEEEQKPDPVLEGLNALKATMDTITTRIDGLEAKIPTTPTEEEEETPEHFQPKTWDEIPQKAEEIAQDIVEQKFAEKEEETKAAEEQKQAEQKQIDTFIDNQITALEKDNKLPKVENANDENDKGRAARREVLGLAARLKTMDLGAVYDDVLQFRHQAGYTYDPKANNMVGAWIRSNSTPSGINAPVSSPSRSTSTPGNPSYEQIHNSRSLDAIVRSQMGE